MTSVNNCWTWTCSSKPESLWWTSKYKDEDRATLWVGKEFFMWDLHHKEVFEVPGYRYHRDGKGFQGAERTFCKGMASWWRDRYVYSSKSVPMKTRCQRVLSHVYSTTLNDSVNWSWSIDMLTRVLVWESKFHVSPFAPRCTPERAGQDMNRERAVPCASHGARWACPHWSRKSLTTFGRP